MSAPSFLAHSLMVASRWIMPTARRTWADAMAAEFDTIAEPAAALDFASGCLLGAGRERMSAMAKALRTNSWLAARWSAAAALLALPAVAMWLGAEGVNWDAADFTVFGAMLTGTGLAYEFLAGRTGNMAYRAGAALAMATAFMLVWMNIAVGIIGSEANPANLMFAGVLAVLCGGTVIAHFRARGMSRALAATAIAQVVVGIVALAANMGADGPAWPRDVSILTLCYAALWLGSGALFAAAARQNGQRPAQ